MADKQKQLTTHKVTGENETVVQENRKKKYRRMAADIEKQFECPYPRCNKSYGSDVSLNLHIKIKHGGGNKTERRKLAVSYIIDLQKQIILNTQTGNHLPKVDINFPPNYLSVHITLYFSNSRNKSIFYRIRKKRPRGK